MALSAATLFFGLTVTISAVAPQHTSGGGAELAVVGVPPRAAPALARRQGLFGPGDADIRLDPLFSQPAPGDRRVYLIAPTFWWNDASDATVGVRVRSYARAGDRWTLWLLRGVSGFEHATSGDVVDGYVSWEHSGFLGNPNLLQGVEAWSQEGTVGARLEVSALASDPAPFGGARHGWVAQWVATRQTNFLDDVLWQNAGTVEVGRFDDWRIAAWGGRLRIRLEPRFGLTYSRLGASTTDPKPFGRMTASGSLQKPLLGFIASVRGFLGAYLAADPPVLQRRIPLDGADPYETLRNPFVRTQGALLSGSDILYHSPGNGNLRGFRPGAGGRWMAGGTVELERALFELPRGMVRRVALMAFGDGAFVDTLAVPSNFGNGATPVSDAGVGVRVGLQIGETHVPFRIEFPFFVSEPALARERIPGRERVDFRWLISFQPIF